MKKIKVVTNHKSMTVPQAAVKITLCGHGNS